MEHLCRLCLSETSRHNLNDVFLAKVRGSPDSLVDILFWTFSIEVTVTDRYPKTICTECIQLIEYVLEIKNNFRRNQEQMILKYLNKNPTDSTKKADHKIKHKERPIVYTSEDDSQSLVKDTLDTDIIKVKLRTLEQMCPLVVIQPLETTQDYMQYKPVGHGRFKKRKYRHFLLDDNLLGDICGLLEQDHNGKMRKQIEVSSDGNFKRDPPKTPKRKRRKCKSSPNQGHQTLGALSPKVYLEPVDRLLARENYKKITDLCYAKEKDYAFSDSDSAFNVSSVCKVYVCDYCAKSFLSSSSLNMHRDFQHGSNNGASSITRRKSLPAAVSGDDYSKTYNGDLRHISLGLRQRKVLSYRVDRVNKRKHSKSGLEKSGSSPNVNYAWEKKTLGTYSAIKFCNVKLKSSLHNTNGLTKNSDLDDTVRKLSSRLDRSS